MEEVCEQFYFFNEKIRKEYNCSLEDFINGCKGEIYQKEEYIN
jgi:hypothetical protein